MTTPTEAEIQEALKAVEVHGPRVFPVGKDRAALCHAAAVLSVAYRAMAARVEAQSRTISSHAADHDIQLARAETAEQALKNAQDDLAEARRDIAFVTVESLREELNTWKHHAESRLLAMEALTKARDRAQEEVYTSRKIIEAAEKVLMLFKNTNGHYCTIMFGDKHSMECVMVQNLLTAIRDFREKANG